MEFSSQIRTYTSSIKTLITKLLVIMLLLHIVPALSKNNDSKQQQLQQQLHQAPQKHHFFKITKITRLKFGQDQFLLNNTNITSNNNNNKDGSGSSEVGCGIACSTIFNAYSLSDSCKCSCPRSFQTYLTGENRCESNDKRKARVKFDIFDPLLQ